MKSILLVNFDFPPNYGIGGRRWAKLAKGMAMQNVHIDVIKADPISTTKISPWQSDTLSEKINIHSLPRPVLSEWISHPHKSIVGKIKYRLALSITKLLHRGTPYDISVGWRKILLRKITELRAVNHYKTIIATGAPWQMLNDLADFVSANKNLELIVDFRDPWIGSKNYGIQGLSNSRLEAEMAKQLNVLRVAKIVFTPCEYITENLKSFCFSRGNTNTQFITLEHFYDRDDMPVKLTISQRSDTFKIIYAGEVYGGTAQMLSEIIGDIQNINAELATKNKKIELDIYTDTNLNPVHFKAPSIQLLPSIGKGVFEVIANSDACLILLPPHKKEEKTTKFFEYLPMKKPLLVASEKGSTLDYVVGNNIGFAWKEDGQFKWLDSYLAGKPMRNDTFDMEAHELQTRAKQVIELLT